MPSRRWWRERPQLKTFANRFAGLPVRNSGTLGGNVANGSPIGDSMPLLIALGAHVVLMSVRGHRELPLEDFYTGYRKTVLAPDEVLAWIKVPRPQPGEFLRAYKISKRYDDDISAVCLVVNLVLDHGKVAKISIGAGGVAPTPARAVKTQAFLLGQPWTQDTAARSGDSCCAPSSSRSRTCAPRPAYRSAVLGNLMQRFWLESQGMEQINLERFDARGVGGMNLRDEFTAATGGGPGGAADAGERNLAPATRSPHVMTSSGPASGASLPHESARAQVAGAATYVDDIPEVKGTLARGAHPVHRGPWPAARRGHRRGAGDARRARRGAGPATFPATRCWRPSCTTSRSSPATRSSTSAR